MQKKRREEEEERKRKLKLIIFIPDAQKFQRRDEWQSIDKRTSETNISFQRSFVSKQSSRCSVFNCPRGIESFNLQLASGEGYSVSIKARQWRWLSEGRLRIPIPAFLYSPGNAEIRAGLATIFLFLFFCPEHNICRETASRFTPRVLAATFKTKYFPVAVPRSKRCDWIQLDVVPARFRHVNLLTSLLLAARPPLLRSLRRSFVERLRCSREISRRTIDPLQLYRRISQTIVLVCARFAERNAKQGYKLEKINPGFFLHCNLWTVEFGNGWTLSFCD